MKTTQKQRTHKMQSIPVVLTKKEFKLFVLPGLKSPTKGPKRKISDFKIFNYILYLLHTGCQWIQLPIKQNSSGEPEIHPIRIYNAFRYWLDNGSFDRIFECTVAQLFERKLLKLDVLHGDGTCTVAKKGGDNIGRNGHKHHKGDKVVALCDRSCHIICPFISAPGNRHETKMLDSAVNSLKRIAKNIGLSIKEIVMSLDGAYDSRANRKLLHNNGMVPNIPKNKRNSKPRSAAGRKPKFDKNIYDERFRTIERVFAWEDKFRRVLVRFERISLCHYGLKTLAYSMINLRSLI